jgi:hypothetical protein
MSSPGWLAALIRKFHGGQVPGEFYKPSGIYHSLGARGGPHDANGNRLDRNGNVIGYHEAYYGSGSDINPLTRRSAGTWLNRSR